MLSFNKNDAEKPLKKKKKDKYDPYNNLYVHLSLKEQKREICNLANMREGKI